IRLQFSVTKTRREGTRVGVGNCELLEFTTSTISLREPSGGGVNDDFFGIPTSGRRDKTWHWIELSPKFQRKPKVVALRQHVAIVVVIELAGIDHLHGVRRNGNPGATAAGKEPLTKMHREISVLPVRALWAPLNHIRRRI